MKHVEEAIKDAVIRAKNDRTFVSYFQPLVLSFSKLYPSSEKQILDFAKKELANVGIIDEKPKHQIQARTQEAAVYDTTTYVDAGCVTCGDTPMQIIETQGEVQGIVSDVMDSDDLAVEAFIKSNDTKAFTKFLKSKDVNVSKEDSKDLEKLIQLYADYKGQ